MGVDVQTVTRAHNEFLTREVALTRSMAESDGTRLAQLQQLEQVFGTGEAGLATRRGTSQFLRRRREPPQRHRGTPGRARAGRGSRRGLSGGERPDRADAGRRGAGSAQLDQDRQPARQHRGRAEPADRRGQGHRPRANDLLDQRDAAVAEISGYLQVTTLPADDGSLQPVHRGGQALVLGGNASTLSAIPDPFDPARVQVGPSPMAERRALSDGVVLGARSPGCCASRTSTFAMRATPSVNSPPPWARSTRSSTSAWT